jgi:hypothetical protein
MAAMWGFGNAPLKSAHREKVERAILLVLSLLNSLPSETSISLLEAISLVKGQFTRVVKQDQWDWSTVWLLLGRPSRQPAKTISNGLGALRTALKIGDTQRAEEIRTALLQTNICKYLHEFLKPQANDTEVGAHIYVLSSRLAPTLLNIGVTAEALETKINQINSTLTVPLGLRAAWKVGNAKDTELNIRPLFSKYQVKGTINFYNVNFFLAFDLINDFLSTDRWQRRYVSISPKL